jgi:hypothetical protein
VAYCTKQSEFQSTFLWSVGRLWSDVIEYDWPPGPLLKDGCKKIKTRHDKRVLVEIHIKFLPNTFI